MGNTHVGNIFDEDTFVLIKCHYSLMLALLLYLPEIVAFADDYGTCLRVHGIYPKLPVQLFNSLIPTLNSSRSSPRGDIGFPFCESYF